MELSERIKLAKANKDNEILAKENAKIEYIAIYSAY